MIQSRFTKWVFIIPLLSIGLFSVLVFAITQKEVFFKPNTPILFTIFFSLFFLWIQVILILGELRTKAILIILDKDTIVTRSFMGIGPKTALQVSHLTGYKTATIKSKAGDFEYLYMIGKGRTVVKLSTFYHANYYEIKRILISMRIKNLGVEYPSLLRETLESFQL